MLNDQKAAAVERAAAMHARAAMAENGKLWTRAAILAALETAFIAGECNARQLAVAEMDDVLANANAARSYSGRMHQNCATCECPDPCAVRR